MTITCPVTTCGAENEAPVTVCTRCGADLRAYALALAFHHLCFNRALEHARSHRLDDAERELHACLTLRPADEHAALLLGKIRWAQRRRAAARRLWQHLAAAAADPAVREIASRCLQAAAGSKDRRSASKRKRPRKTTRG